MANERITPTQFAALREAAMQRGVGGAERRIKDVPSRFEVYRNLVKNRNNGNGHKTPEIAHTLKTERANQQSKKRVATTGIRK